MGSASSPTVGDLLRQQRSRARLTQEELAERSGYSTDYISKLERGQRLPPRTAIDRLGLVLGLDEATQDRLQAARTHTGPDAPPDPAAYRPIPATLPTQVTSFVGRDEEIASISALIDGSAVRLLTLTGPGGIRKTRLVVRVCELLARRAPDEIWYVPLASLTDPEHVAPAIASVLGVTEKAGVSVTDAVVRFLSQRPGLLVLDNFEHVLSAAPFVGLLVERCPGLRVVVTSRAALSLASEHRVEVPALAAAVTLFVERAQAVRPGFRLDEATADEVGAICAALDGLPLAIELAAARLRLFPPRALRQRLSRRLPLLSGGPIDRPPRQQTLRSTIDWSFDLLSPQERQLFARLGVFAGGGSLDAIEDVCDPGGDLDVVGLLTALVDQSLVQHGGDVEARVWLLQTMREYADERLSELGEREVLRARHASHYAALVTRIEPLLVDEQQDEALRRLDLEVDNVRAAMSWLVEQGRVEEQLELATTVSWYQVARCRGTEAIESLERGLGAGPAVSDAVRSHALLALGEVAIRQGDLQRAGDALDAARSLCEALGDPVGVGQALSRLGVIAYRRGDYDRAVASADVALRLATAAGDRRERAYALVTLGTVATHRGEHALARDRLTEAVELNRAIGGRDAMAHALINLGYDLTLQGQLEEATTIFEELLETSREFGLKRHVAYALENLGNIGVLRGDFAGAAAHLRDGLVLGRELSDQHLLLYLFSDLVKLHAACGRMESAARLGGVVTAVRRRLGLSMAPAEDQDRAHALEAARSELGDVRFEVAYTAGLAMTLDEALADALS